MPSSKPERVDVVIVGIGASGGTAAMVLSEGGLTVVGLDRGPWLQPDKHFSADELKFVNRNYLGPDTTLNPRTVRANENSTARISTVFSNAVRRRRRNGALGRMASSAYAFINSATIAPRVSRWRELGRLADPL